MVQDEMNLAAMAEALGKSTDYRVLRRLVPRSTFMPAPEQEVRTGILLDTETTGLDARKDEIIELGMVKFAYLPDGRIVGVRDTFSAFNEPSVPIPAEITALTGIADEMVNGQRISTAGLHRKNRNSEMPVSIEFLAVSRMAEREILAHRIFRPYVCMVLYGIPNL